MALKDIIEKIRSDGTADVVAIEMKRDAELAAIKTKHQAFVIDRTTLASNDTQRRADKVAERILAKARHQAQFLAGEAEQAKLENVFIAIKVALEALDDKTYQSFVVKQYEALGKPTAGTFIVASTKVNLTHQALIGSGVSANNIQTEDGNSLLGGFLFVTKNQEFDCSFRGLLQKIRNQHTVTVASKLIKY